MRRLIPRPHNAAALAAGLGAALLLASCSKGSKVVAPIVVTTPPPGPMITLTGNPRLSCDLQLFVNRPANADTLSGYFYVMLNDSVPQRTFVGPTSLNGAPMRFELDSFSRPQRYVLRPVDLVSGYAADNALHFTIADSIGTTTPFGVAIAPTTLDLPPDGATLSQSQDLVLHWQGAAELVKVTLSDIRQVKVFALLQFQNETGVSELRIRAQDLKVLQPGAIVVGASTTNSEAIELPSTLSFKRQVSAVMTVTEGRNWTLVP